MRPIGNHVLVALRPEPEETVSEAGLVLVRDPDRYKTPTQGIVVALGEKAGSVDLEEVRASLAEAKDPTWRSLTIEKINEVLDSFRPSPFDVQVGDCVVFSRSVGDEFSEKGVDYVVLREADILGIVDRESEAA